MWLEMKLYTTVLRGARDTLVASLLIFQRPFPVKLTLEVGNILVFRRQKIIIVGHEELALIRGL